MNNAEEYINENEDYGEYDEYIGAFEKRRIKSIEKRRRRIEQGEPGTGRSIAMRSVELCAAMIIMSLLVSFMLICGLPMWMLVAGVIAYVAFAGFTSYHQFWMIEDSKEYLKVNLGALAVLVIITVILKVLLPVEIFSWMFMLTKAFLLMGIRLWMSMVIIYAIVAVVIMAIAVIMSPSLRAIKMHEEYEE